MAVRINVRSIMDGIVLREMARFRFVRKNELLISSGFGFFICDFRQFYIIIL